ncbi:DUF1538 domain-containing protein [Peloplasma aerotolerans]|uniref:DUF1538 domain-containing protein n=1 Tax=Peloplasma aerotolerans TaxID=3044389 RepID=A0AAW6UCZ7_9MOLU|nr:DUF1538 domain-containing protein [Mariniplasma sp. M4Ah]MDI6452848.1 DUF1538 domain-containing protein [Mariniplasma sp. M4Ah]MDR4968491.1 DUF1538 domain-containing protein [Acholeplasmataceae bacterium]
MKFVLHKLFDSMIAVLPISVVILIISLLIGIDGQYIINFIVGSLLLMIGLTFFSIGSVSSMVAIAESIGEFIVKKRKLLLFIVIAFIVGFMINIAEPALWVLADQFKSVVIEPVLILSVALGVGIFVVLALIRILTQIKLRTLILISYAVVFGFAILLFMTNPSFIPVAFDSGGVTTGPMAVPFIMALGFGISKSRGDRASEEDSFGLVGIASIGPILSVLILGLFYSPTVPISDTTTSFMGYLVRNLVQMAIAILPFILFFMIFQVFAFKLKKRRVIKILIAFGYTYIGLVLFLTGANAGLVDMGLQMGAYFANLNASWILVPVGMVFGFVIVAAEPSVVALNRQVEEVSAGAISSKLMLYALAVGVSVAIGLACVRVLTGVSIWWFLLPGYGLALILMFFTPKIFTGIAFDSGGAVSGAMTSAFLMPYALGAAMISGTNVLSSAFGLIAFVAMAPLITIQLLGFIYRAKVDVYEEIEEDEIMDLSEVKS